MRRRAAVTCLAVLGSLHAPVSADEIVVLPGGSIQNAINNASDGDVIIVQPSTYVENIDFLKKEITVRSSDGPEVTILRPTGEANPMVRINRSGPATVFAGLRQHKVDIQRDTNGR